MTKTLQSRVISYVNIWQKLNALTALHAVCPVHPDKEETDPTSRLPQEQRNIFKHTHLRTLFSL